MHSIDPYLALAQANNFADYGMPPEWVAVMIELKDSSCVAPLIRLQASNPLDLRLMFWTHPVTVISGAVRLVSLCLLDSFTGIKRYELAEAYVPHRMPSRFPAVPYGHLVAVDDESLKPSGKTLRAVIDTGCPFAHRDLRKDGCNTVVRAIWDQDKQPDFGYLGTVPANTTCAYGAVIERKWLHAAIAESSTHSYVGERACYVSTGYGELERKASHGAHVLGLFTNGGCSPPTNDDNDLLFVQLPRDVLSAPSRAALGKAIFDGVQWILSEAVAANESADRDATKFENVIVNISYSAALGPHDGSSIFERGMSALFTLAKEHDIELTVVFAAGNDYAERLHACVPKLEAKKTSTLRWRLPPGNELPSFLEIWLPYSAHDVQICVKLPSGDVIDMESMGTAMSDGCHTVTLVNGQWTAGDGARLVLVRIAPSLAIAGSAAAASGDYSISLTSCVAVEYPVHAYVSHARGTMEYPVRGSQSYLVARRVEPWTPPPPPSQENSFVDPCGTLSGLCCFGESTVVGGYKYKVARGKQTEYPADYTASGPARIPFKKDCPDYSELSEEKPSLPGVRGIGNYSAVTVRLNGTSVAAPQIARHIAGLSKIATNVCDPRLGDAVKFQCVSGPAEDAMSVVV